MSTLLNSLKEAASASASASASNGKTEAVEITLSTLSSPISGKYGTFRKFQFDGVEMNVDEKNISNVQVYRPNTKAVLTIRQYEKEGATKTVVAGLSLLLPEASGLFVMR